MKLILGLVLHSVSVTADAFNNLSDAGSSIISFIGVKMAEKPADEEHPFGRSLLLSFSVLLPAAPLQRYSTPCSPDTAPSTLWTQTRSSDRKIIALLLAFIISQPLPEPHPPRRSPRSGRACRPAVWSSCRH